jgi:hypothetical protein
LRISVLRIAYCVLHISEKAILAIASTPQKWTLFGEYSHLLNLRSSSHCLEKAFPKPVKMIKLNNPIKEETMFFSN